MAVQVLRRGHDNVSLARLGVRVDRFMGQRHCWRLQAHRFCVRRFYSVQDDFWRTGLFVAIEYLVLGIRGYLHLPQAQRNQLLPTLDQCWLLADKFNMCPVGQHPGLRLHEIYADLSL